MIVNEVSTIFKSLFTTNFLLKTFNPHANTPQILESIHKSDEKRVAINEIYL